MHSSSSKRRTLLKRIVAYAAMTATVVGLSTVLVFLMLGYRFNRYSGTIQQGGLVQFISQPSGASVSVGDIQLANKTRSKITLNPGDYLVKMSRDGYQPWSKNVTVKAGTVLWLNSARLVPENPETVPVLPLPTVASTSVQPGSDYFAILAKSTSPDITLVDISGDSIDKRTIRLITSQYHAAKKHRFTLGEWLGDNRILMKHGYGSAQEWVVVDINNPEKSYVVSGSNDSSPLEVIADPRSSDRVLVLRNDGSVTLENVVSGESTPLPVKNVTEITADGNALFYVSTSKKSEQSTNYLTLGKTQPRRIASYSSKATVHVASDEYFGVRHITTSVGKTVTLVKVLNWSDSDSTDPLRLQTTKTITLPTSPTFVSFKSQGRFVLVQRATAQMTYDIELGVESDVPIVGESKRLSHRLHWLDGFHYWSDAGGHMRQYEFDGTNQTDIVDVAPGFSALYSPDQKYLYTIGRADKGLQLQRTTMVID